MKYLLICPFVMYRWSAIADVNGCVDPSRDGGDSGRTFDLPTTASTTRRNCDKKTVYATTNLCFKHLREPVESETHAKCIHTPTADTRCSEYTHTDQTRLWKETMHHWTCIVSETMSAALSLEAASHDYPPPQCSTAPCKNFAAERDRKYFEVLRNNQARRHGRVNRWRSSLHYLVSPAKGLHGSQTLRLVKGPYRNVALVIICYYTATFNVGNRRTTSYACPSYRELTTSRCCTTFCVSQYLIAVVTACYIFTRSPQFSRAPFTHAQALSLNAE